jgi:DNA-binding transcriptional LysR family regulator
MRPRDEWSRALDWIASFLVFDRVATTLNFTVAARQLKLSQGAVSRQIRALEEELGAPLFHRTTRKISLTEIGQGFHQRCARILEDLEEARRLASDLHAEPRGQLRITAPVPLGQRYLAGAIAQFLARYPQISVEVVLTDRLVDLIDEGFDLAIRVGNLPDSSLVARALAPVRFVVCAAPRYLARRGTPKRPADLKRHDCLRFTHHGPTWHFSGPDGDQDVPVQGRLTSNNPELLYAAALAGEGVFYAPTFQTADGLRSGQLVPILTDYQLLESRIQALFPPGGSLSAKVRCLLEFLVGHFGPEPEWDRSL